MISLQCYRADSIRIQRTVYDQWNSVSVAVKNPDGTTALTLTVDCTEFNPDHKPLPVLWETPDFPQDPTSYGLLAQPREAYSIKLQNQPEDPHLTEIRALADAWASLTLSADEAIVAIREVLTGRPESDYPAETRSPEEIRQQAAADSLDDEIPF